MTIQSILLPVFVLVFLMLSLLVWMARERMMGTHARAQQVSACFSNQSELPPLFHILAVLAIMTRKADWTFVIMEWLFVLTRLGHAFIFTTSNNIKQRGGIFLLGALILILMWLIFAVRILISPTFATV
jgi:hypothetical protein